MDAAVHPAAPGGDVRGGWGGKGGFDPLPGVTLCEAAATSGSMDDAGIEVDAGEIVVSGMCVGG